MYAAIAKRIASTLVISGPATHPPKKANDSKQSTRYATHHNMKGESVRTTIPRDPKNNGNIERTRSIKKWIGWRGHRNIAPYIGRLLKKSTANSVATIAEYVAAGANEILIALLRPFDHDELRVLAEEVLPKVREASGAP